MPPYDWNDMTEKSKDDALTQLAENGCPQAAPYWHLAKGSESYLNWIAKWFLYHKFRYRDGRNKLKHSKRRKFNSRHDDRKHHGTLHTLLRNTESSISKREKTNAINPGDFRTLNTHMDQFQPIPDAFHHEVDGLYDRTHAAQLERKRFDPVKDVWV